MFETLCAHQISKIEWIFIESIKFKRIRFWRGKKRTREIDKILFICAYLRAAGVETPRKLSKYFPNQQKKKIASFTRNLFNNLFYTNFLIWHFVLIQLCLVWLKYLWEQSLKLLIYFQVFFNFNKKNSSRTEPVLYIHTIIC